jgi:hypothetical protein
MRLRDWATTISTSAGLLLASCSFDKPADIGEEDAATGDAATTDTPLFDATPLDCEPDSIVCDDGTDTYVDCGSDGTAEFVLDCPLGCSGSEEKCVDVDPSNGLAIYLDMASTGPDVAFTGTSTIDGTTVFNGATSVEVPTFLVGGVQVFVFRSLSVAGTLRITGDEPVAFIVDGDVMITGTIDASADGWMGGPGGLFGYDEDDSDSCTGAGNSGASPTPGAGGGGHYNTGGVGGSTTVASGSTGGATTGTVDLQPLRGGCAGGYVLESEMSYGGGGGGGLQITSRTRISLTSLAAIDASGGGANLASSGTSARGGGGGGSGGSILLEAPQVTIEGAGVAVSTKGGGGSSVYAGTGTSWRGQDGGVGASAAAGGTNGGLPGGGQGGTETLAPGSGQSAATSGQDGGGGGGSVGRARFNTTSGAINPQAGAAIRSRYTAGPLRTRLVP